MTEATKQIGRLAGKYSELSLSGSFSSQVKKSVKLLETHLECIRGKSDPTSIEQMEASLAQLREKLRLLELAADADREKIARGSLSRFFTRLDSSLHGIKTWDNKRVFCSQPELGGHARVIGNPYVTM